MLKTMEPFPGLVCIRADKRENINIIIKTLNIGKRMMIHIVFLFPQVGAASHQVKGIPHGFIYPVFAGITSMGPIVHYIEPDRGQVKAHQDT